MRNPMKNVNVGETMDKKVWRPLYKILFFGTIILLAVVITQKTPENTSTSSKDPRANQRVTNSTKERSLDFSEENQVGKFVVMVLDFCAPMKGMFSPGTPAFWPSFLPPAIIFLVVWLCITGMRIHQKKPVFKKGEWIYMLAFALSIGIITGLIEYGIGYAWEYYQNSQSTIN